MTDLDPEAREALEVEREFLMRSLADLEDEHAVGNIDAGTYQQLHDDYTARAAGVIRSLEAGADLTTPGRPPASVLARTLTITGIVAFALVAAFLLTHAIGQRHPGQTITGNSQASKNTPTTAGDPGPALAAEVKRSPDNYAAHVAYARYLLQTLDYPNAILQFGAAARLDRSQPEPPTYAGWAGALIARQIKDAATRETLLSAALERINEVIKTHPKYPDAYALKGVILFDFEQKARDAIPSFQQFLLLTDDSNPLRSQVLDVLAKAEKAAQAAGTVQP